MLKKAAAARVSGKSKKASAAKTASRKVSLTVSSAKRGLRRKQERDRESTKKPTKALAKVEQREKQLRESDGQVWALLEAAAQGILVVGRDGRIRLVNAFAEKMFGYDREELLGQPVEMLLPGNFHNAHRRHRREFFAHPRTRPMGQGLDLFARRKNGTTFPVEINLSHIEPEGDTLAAAFISDITERKRTEEARRESEERFRIAAQCGNDLIYEWNLESSVLEWWGDIEACLGYRPRTLEVFEKALHPEDHDRVMGAVQRHLENGDPFAQQYRVRAKDRTYHCWWDRGMALRDAQSKPYKWIGACTDITERKVAEQELREQHAFNAALLDTVRALVVVLDREGRIVRFNKACQETTGYSFEEVRGRQVWEFLLVPEEAAAVRRVFRKVKAGQVPVRFENYWATKNGERRLISWSNTALLDSSGTMSFGIGTGLDITEQRRLEETIRQSHNDLRKLTARLISAQEGAYKHLARELHDGFSQKLAILGMHVSELEQKLLAAGMPMEEGLKPIGEEISGLATEIHGISRRLHPVILDDLGLAVALRNECLAFSREHGIEVRFHARSVPASIPGGVALCLYRVAQESLNNIRKHAKTGLARVTLAGHPREIALSIEDVGKGFQPEEVRGKGGLGLVSMEERARLVDGKLTIQSKPGDGTIIQVRVPLRIPEKGRGKQ